MKRAGQLSVLALLVLVAGSCAGPRAKSPPVASAPSPPVTEGTALPVPPEVETPTARDAPPPPKAELPPIHVAAPPKAGASQGVVQVDPSSVSLPLAFSLAPIVDHLETVFPGGTRDFTCNLSTWNEKRSMFVWPPTAECLPPPFPQKPNGCRCREPVARDLSYRGDRVAYLVSRNAVEMTFADSTLDLKLALAFWAGYSRRFLPVQTCGQSESPRRMVLRLQSTVVVADRWGVVAKSSASPLEWIDRCALATFDREIAPRVEAALRPGIETALRVLEDAVPSALAIRERGERAWEHLLRPIPLDSQTWLVMRPEAARLAPLDGPGPELGTTAGIAVRPTIVIGARPEAARGPLPRLQLTPPGEGFRVTLEAERSFDETTAETAGRLVGRQHMIGSRHVTITGARVFGAGELAAVELVLDGAFRGTVYVTGKPAYDTARDMLHVPDMDWSVETRSLLNWVADWLLLDQAFRKLVAAEVRWPAPRAVVSARRSIEQGVRRSIGPGVALDVKIGAFLPVAVLATPTAFKAVLVAEGRARLDLQ